MTILNFSYAEILDEEKFREYISAAGVLMKKAGVEVVLRSEFVETIAGVNCLPHIAAIFRYTDESAANAFLNSEDYKSPHPPERCWLQNDNTFISGARITMDQVSS